jgi:ferritin-like metal-binding protein YciE
VAISTADDLFIDELKDIYSAEKQAVRIYPRLAKAISSPELKEALQAHLEETKGQIERLDRVFETLEKRSSGKTCEGMKGLIEEGQQHAEEIEQGPVRDSALIGAAQRMEHYEIAAYGTVIAFAKAKGEDEIVKLLSETLEEEKATDQKLTSIAETINEQSVTESEEDEEEDEDEDEDSDEDDEEDEEDGEVEDSSQKQQPKKAAKKTAAKSKK